jgi:hypothetical protein
MSGMGIELDIQTITRTKKCSDRKGGGKSKPSSPIFYFGDDDMRFFNIREKHGNNALTIKRSLSDNTFCYVEVDLGHGLIFKIGDFEMRELRKALRVDIQEEEL